MLCLQICAFNSTSNETLRIGSKGEASFKPSASKNGMYLVFTSKTDKIEILVNLVCVGIPETNLVVLRPAGLKDDLIHPVSSICDHWDKNFSDFLIFYRILSFIHQMLALKH